MIKGVLCIKKHLGQISTYLTRFDFTNFFYTWSTHS